MAEFRPARGLEELAARLVVDQVGKVAEQLQDSAREKAPAGKTWQSRGDGLVRHTHKRADGQQVPENVKYQVQTPQYDREHYDPNPFQLMRYPRDTEGGTPGNTENCRCISVEDPEAVKQSINASRAQQQGRKVTAEVVAKFNRIEESEYGSGDEPGLRFMGRALGEVSAQYRAR